MFLKRLADLRQDHDQTQANIAKALKITQPQYSLSETGERDLPLPHLIALADYYGVSTDYLLGRTNNPRTAQELAGK